jgi:bifunctional non-homologous end joining protein LigD
MSLKKYREKRRFDRTEEPSDKISSKKSKKVDSKPKKIFVVQKHFARSLHYDFRLQIGKTLKSWAVPKGPSKSTKDKRLAVLVEDHPLSYADFEGTIPKGEYGAGKVEIWDRGYFENRKKDEAGREISLKKSMENGQFEIELFGKKLKGKYALIHFKEKNWLLIKMKNYKKS